jgi:hypothetical protein
VSQESLVMKMNFVPAKRTELQRLCKSKITKWANLDLEFKVKVKYANISEFFGYDFNTNFCSKTNSKQVIEVFAIFRGFWLKWP